MTAHKDQIQALIAEIDRVLLKPDPNVSSSTTEDAEQQRQVVERVRSYLGTLQQRMPEGGTAAPANAQPSAPTPSFSIGQKFPANADDPAMSDRIVQAIESKVDALQVNLTRSLREDLERLGQQRQQLAHDIKQLETQQQHLIAQQQPQQEQALAEMLQELTVRLQDTLNQKIAQAVSDVENRVLNANLLSAEGSAGTLASDSSLSMLHPNERLKHLQHVQAQFDDMLLNLDSSTEVIFQTLLNNVQGYQQSLSQSIENMHDLGQQGEVMFAALVNHLAQKLGLEASSYVQSSSLPGETSADATLKNLQAALAQSQIQSNSFLSKGTEQGSSSDSLQEDPSDKPAGAEIPFELPYPGAEVPPRDRASSFAESESGEPDGSLVGPDLSTPPSLNLDDLVLAGTEESAGPIFEDYTDLELDELEAISIEAEDEMETLPDLNVDAEAILREREAQVAAETGLLPDPYEDEGDALLPDLPGEEASPANETDLTDLLAGEDAIDAELLGEALFGDASSLDDLVETPAEATDLRLGGETLPGNFALEASNLLTDAEIEVEDEPVSSLEMTAASRKPKDAFHPNPLREEIEDFYDDLFGNQATGEASDAEVEAETDADADAATVADESGSEALEETETEVGELTEVELNALFDEPVVPTIEETQPVIPTIEEETVAVSENPADAVFPTIDPAIYPVGGEGAQVAAYELAADAPDTPETDWDASELEEADVADEIESESENNELETVAPDLDEQPSPILASGPLLPKLMEPEEFGRRQATTPEIDLFGSEEEPLGFEETPLDSDDDRLDSDANLSSAEDNLLVPDIGFFGTEVTSSDSESNLLDLEAADLIDPAEVEAVVEMSAGSTIEDLDEGYSLAPPPVEAALFEGLDDPAIAEEVASNAATSSHPMADSLENLLFEDSQPPSILSPEPFSPEGESLGDEGITDLVESDTYADSSESEPSLPVVEIAPVADIPEEISALTDLLTELQSSDLEPEGATLSELEVDEVPSPEDASPSLTAVTEPELPTFGITAADSSTEIESAAAEVELLVEDPQQPGSGTAEKESVSEIDLQDADSAEPPVLPEDKSPGEGYVPASPEETLLVEDSGEGTSDLAFDVDEKTLRQLQEDLLVLEDPLEGDNFPRAELESLGTIDRPAVIPSPLESPPPVEESPSFTISQPPRKSLAELFGEEEAEVEEDLLEESTPPSPPDWPSELEEPSSNSPDFDELDALISDWEPEEKKKNPLIAQAEAPGVLPSGSSATLLDDRVGLTAAPDIGRTLPADPAEGIEPRDWYLGIDFGTSGISAALMHRSLGQFYPICWYATETAEAEMEETGEQQRVFRLPTVAALSPEQLKQPDLPMSTVAIGPIALMQVAQEMREAAELEAEPEMDVEGELAPDEIAPQGLLLQHFKPHLTLGIPYREVRQTETADINYSWEPAIKRGQNFEVPLYWDRHALQAFLETLQADRSAGSAARSGLSSAASGLEAHEFNAAMRQLAGVILNHPAGWDDTYQFNLREAVLGAGLVARPEQVFFVNDAIATLLAALQGLNNKIVTVSDSPALGSFASPNSQQIDPLAVSSSWQGATLTLNAGTATTELGLVDLPEDLRTLSSQDFHLLSIPYAGNHLDQDIVCQLLLTASNRWQHLAKPEAVPATDLFETNPYWQALVNQLDRASWQALKTETFVLPRPGDPDVATRAQLQQQLESSWLGKAFLEVARWLKGQLQHQDSLTLELAGQQRVIPRRELEAEVFVPFIQQLNRYLNTLLGQGGLSVAEVRQVICSGGTASIPAIARWLRQKFPNATIVQDIYQSDRIPACSRVAYGLASLPHFPQVLDLPRQQYSDYFLLSELLRIFPERPMPATEVMELLERRGVNTQLCQDRVLAILDGQLPNGLLPSGAAAIWLTESSRQTPIFQALTEAPPFSRVAHLVYRPNPLQCSLLRQYLNAVMACTYQTLKEPYLVALGLPIY